MFSTAGYFSISLIFVFLFQLVAGRAVWMPEDFDHFTGSSSGASLLPRDTSICLTYTGLYSCGASYPSDFCCPVATTCMPLNTTGDVVAAICCPQGQSCALISPVTCDTTQQNATAVPSSGLHADPPQTLATCGSGCCPMGYFCESNECVMLAVSNAPSANSTSATGSTTNSTVDSSTDSSTSSTTGSAPDSTTTTSSGSSSTAEPASSSPVTLPVGSVIPSQTTPASKKFSASSFAAGFVPGIVLGALLVAFVLFCLIRKKNRSISSYINEKGGKHDTLTDLGPLSRRPTYHGRSISEPIDPQTGYRTDFLRTTPPRLAGVNEYDEFYEIDPYGNTMARSPSSVRMPKIKTLFSHSPFLQGPSSPQSTQPPIPAHLKRGTLSFNISPIRALKKQKSMHSLRRQMTDASRHGLTRSRTRSQETIQVLMSAADPYTPDQRLQRAEPLQALTSAVYQPPSSKPSRWHNASPDHSAPQRSASPDSPTSSYPPYFTTPTRAQGTTTTTGMLGTPYSPSTYQPNGVGRAAGEGQYGLREPQKRDTTFSAMMERAGLRKSELIMGPRS